MKNTDVFSLSQKTREKARKREKFRNCTPLSADWDEISKATIRESACLLNITAIAKVAGIPHMRLRRWAGLQTDKSGVLSHQELKNLSSVIYMLRETLI